MLRRILTQPRRSARLCRALVFALKQSAEEPVRQRTCAHLDRFQCHLTSQRPNPLRHRIICTVRRFNPVLLRTRGAVPRAQKQSPFSPHEKAYYADPSVVAYVQPGFRISVVSANIASNGTISVDYKLADPNGAPLDLSGVVTPGPISLSFLAAYIPHGQEQYTSYIVPTVTAASGGATATQATSDSGGSTLYPEYRRPLSSDGANRRGAGYFGMLRVPCEWLGGGAAYRQESCSRSTGPSQSGAGHHVGLHGLSSEPVGFRPRCVQYRSQIRRELRCMPRHGCPIQRNPGACRNVAAG